MQKAIIVDLDNCLFDSREVDKTQPKNKKKREEWDNWQPKLKDCKVNKHIQELVEHFGYKGITILFLTSREARKDLVTITKEKLDSLFQTQPRLGLKYELFMRADGDFRPAAEVKRDLFASCVKDRYNVLFAIDDCPKNIKMFRDLGLNTLLCNYGKGK